MHFAVSFFLYINNVHINNISNYFQITNQLFQVISNEENAILIPKQILYKMYNTMTHFKELLHIVPSIW